jgi:RNA polymerase sigma-70 factor (ECF subfamily)
MALIGCLIPMPDETSGTLLRRVKDRQDVTAWREFDRIYRPLMLRYARARGVSKADTEDIVQQCMQAVSNQMPGFDYDRERGRFKNWLRKLVDNRTIDHYRKQKLPQARTKDLDRPDVDTPPPPKVWDGHWEAEHLRYCLRLIRRSLPGKTYEIFHLYALQEKSAEEVATLLNVSRNQVWLAKSRVLKKLRETMVDLFGSEQADY